MESKMKIYQIMPPASYPSTVFIGAGCSRVELERKISSINFPFPFIAKPDIGMKGKGVALIADAGQLKIYLEKFSGIDILLQERVVLENEIGLFYFRYPGTEKGNISGIVGKNLLSVTGDGRSNIKELLFNDERGRLQLRNISKNLTLDEIIPAGEKRTIVPFGNHARGAEFINLSHLANESLLTVFDNYCKSIPEFYFGRLDIRFNSWEELKRGENFSVIELNGAGSEPTHIYDPSQSIFFAWKEICRHWNILQKISAANRKRGFAYLTFSKGSALMRRHIAYVKNLNRITS